MPTKERYRREAKAKTIAESTETGKAAALAAQARATNLTRGSRGQLPSDPESIWREMVALLLGFNRFSVEQLSNALGVPETEIETLRADPDLVQLVRDLRAVMPMPGEINELLMSDAERNIRWLRKVRDGLIDDDPKRLRIRERAAETLLDRQVPRKVAVQVTDEKPRAIDITPQQHARMRALLNAPTGEDLELEMDAEQFSDGDASGQNKPVEHGETGAGPSSDPRSTDEAGDDGP